MKIKDLTEICGLPIKLKGNKLEFGKGMQKVIPDVRTFEQMKPVLKNPKAKTPKDFYYMYREVCIEKDREKIRKNNLRYDITVLPGFKVGDEYNKTLGHFHPKNYPEVYEVLSGKAMYLLQSDKEFMVYDARPGDKCLMFPKFGHITINPSSEPLVMANWVYPGFASEYGAIKEKKGAAWFYTENGFTPNTNYEKIPVIKIVTAKEFQKFGLTSKPMYQEGIKNPKKFEWLSKPEKYKKLFEEYLKY